MASVSKITPRRKSEGAGNFGILMGAVGGTVLFLVGGFALLGALSPGDHTQAQFFRNDFDKAPPVVAEKTVPQQQTAVPKRQETVVPKQPALPPMQASASRMELTAPPKEQTATVPEEKVQEQPLQQEAQQPATPDNDPVTTGAIENQQTAPVTQAPAPKAKRVRHYRQPVRPSTKRAAPKNTTNPLLQLFGG